VKFIKQTLLSVLAVGLFAGSAFAQHATQTKPQRVQRQPTFGNEGSGGGDSCEPRIREIAREIRSWIFRGGAKQLDLNGVTNLKSYEVGMVDQIGGSTKRKIKYAGINCTSEPIKIGNVEKTCKNERDENGRGYVTCNLTRFMQNTNEDEQFRLVHHEYAALAGFEASYGNESSKYPISDQLGKYMVNRTVRTLGILSEENRNQFSFDGCAADETRLNNACVPTKLDFHYQCAIAGGLLINQDICMNKYPVDIMQTGIVGNLPPLLTPNNRTNSLAQVKWNGKPLIIRRGDRLNFVGSGTYGKFPYCNARSFNGTNVSTATQNYNEDFKEGLVASDGVDLIHLGDNRTQNPTSMFLSNRGTLYVGLNTNYGTCTNIYASVKIQLDQCTNRSMQAVQCQ